MSESFTKGPWVWHQRGGYHDLVHFTGEADYDGSPAFVRIHSDGSACDEYSPDIDVNGPDAALIAAAPELYEALKRARSLLAKAYSVTAPTIRAADAALAKARGEEGA